MRTALAFLLRDARLAMSYRMAFFGQVAFIFLGVSLFYYLSLVLDGGTTSALDAYGGNYFAFLLIGVALTDFLKVSLSTFNTSIREHQMMGTLEMVLLSPVPLSSMLIYSSLWSYVFASLRFLLYLIIGAALYGFELGQANLIGGVLMLVLSVVCFSAFGIVTSAFIMVFKKGDVSNLMSVASIFLGGVLFPPSVLPAWLKTASALLPITHSVTGMRHALLSGYSMSQLLPEMLVLLGFSVALFPIGFWAFAVSVRRTKITGTLGQY